MKTFSNLQCEEHFLFRLPCFKPVCTLWLLHYLHCITQGQTKQPRSCLWQMCPRAGRSQMFPRAPHQVQSLGCPTALPRLSLRCVEPHNTPTLTLAWKRGKSGKYCRGGTHIIRLHTPRCCNLQSRKQQNPTKQICWETSRFCCLEEMMEETPEGLESISSCLLLWWS